MTDIPDSLKHIKPFIDRGREVEKHEPIVSYYAFRYAFELAMKGTITDEKPYLLNLMNMLEERKKTFDQEGTALTPELGYEHVETFALKVFLNADNEDRDGKASKKTAKSFLAASTFLELLRTFDELGYLDPDVDAKIKYSKWKAADIIKALKEGRVPKPGPPGEENEVESAEPETTEPESAAPENTLPDIQMQSSPEPQTHISQQPPSIADFPSPPGNFTMPLPQVNAVESTPTVAISSSETTNTAPSVVPSYVQTSPQAPAPAANHGIAPKENFSYAEKDEIVKKLKFALSAMDYDDFKTTRKYVAEVAGLLQ